MIDAMAKRYGTLPSQVLDIGDSFDLMVFDVACTTELVNSYKQQNKPLPPELFNRKQVDDLAEKYYGHKNRQE